MTSEKGNSHDLSDRAIPKQEDQTASGYQSNLYSKQFRRVLLTGGNGFIGSHLVKRLIAEGVETHIITRSDSDLSLINGCLHEVEVHVYDGSQEALQHIIARVKPYMVFHLAASTGGADGDIERIVAANITLGSGLLEAMAQNGCGFFINTGSFWQHYENVKGNPVNFYAASKQAFEQILSYYGATHGIRFISLHLFDSYASDDPRPKILSLLRDAFRSGETLDMTGGEQFVYPVHVEDIVEAYLLAGKHLTTKKTGLEKIYFVRDKESITLKDLVGLLSVLCDGEISVKWGAKPYRPREFMTDVNCFPDLPGWHTRVALKDGLRDFLVAANG